MADGLLGKCKTCTRADVKANRRARAEQYSEYERNRFQKPARRAAVYAQSALHRERFPTKVKARHAVRNATRDGRLVREPCRDCGTTEGVEGHHPDYTKPLEVEWLCKKCHMREHYGVTG